MPNLTSSLESILPENSRLVALGVTGNWAFAAGTVILALLRHNPKLSSDILIFHDRSLLKNDLAIFQDLGCKLANIPLNQDTLSEELLKIFSPICLAKFFCLDLLDRYSQILWLDADLIIQDSIEPIWNYGPFSMAEEDAAFYENSKPHPASINFTKKVDDFLPSAPNYNSGVILFANTLPNPSSYHKLCLQFLAKVKAYNRFADQGAFNWLAQKIKATTPQDWKELPVEFNCHPRNPKALLAPIVHAFGAYKLWNDGLTSACFPEWQRDLERWKKLGGSTYKGTIENSNYLNQGTFALLTNFFNTYKQSESIIETLKSKLEKEQNLNRKLEHLIDILRTKS
ncbi:MAG: glycosyl transferase family 8 [Desulfovibrionaceae bacterium]|nr:glycosyl transferase family 8 [Desulfovibrionaceae bacterium]